MVFVLKISSVTLRYGNDVSYHEQWVAKIYPEVERVVPGIMVVTRRTTWKII